MSPFRLGPNNEPNNLYVGSDAVQRIYHGSEQVWPTITSPVITGVPTIAGAPTEGQTLTAAPASVTGSPTPTRTWQWERSGTPIAGATNATYTLTATDVGETLTVVQTETNSGGSVTAESAASAVILASGSIPETVTITEVGRSLSGVAFDAVTLEADLSGAGFNDTTLRHEFYWTSDYNYQLTSVPKVTAEGYGNAHELVGGVVTFVLPEERTYNITVLAVELDANYRPTGNLAQGTTQITVGSADTYFSGTNTICVSTSGNFAGAPAGAVLVTSSDLAQVYYDEIGDTATPKRLMARGGETFTWTGALIDEGDILFDTFGSGRATVNTTGDIQLAAGRTATVADYARDVRCRGWNWIGNYNSNTNTFSSGGAITLISAIWPTSPCNMVHFHQSDAIGFARHSYLTSNTGRLDTQFVVSDATWRDYRDSIFYAFALRVCAFVGIHYGSRDDARVRPGVGVGNEGFPHRTDATHEIMTKSQGMNKQGWSGWINGFVATQGCIRARASELTPDGVCMLTENVWQGGSSILSMGIVQDGAGARPGAERMALIERNTFIGGNQTSSAMGVNHVPLIVRNCKISWPDIETTPQSRFGPTAFRFGDSNGAESMTPSDMAQPIRAYSNTAVDKAGRAIEEFYADAGLSNVVVENNLLFGATTADGPINETALYDTTAEGYRDESGALLANSATPADTVGTFRPTSGAGAAGAATTGATTYRDRAGVNRANPPSAGALEPS